MGVGGPARYFTEVRTVDEMQEAILFCLGEKIPYMVLGKGSNTLFDDKGYNGLVILNKIDFFENPAEGKFHIGGGASFSLLGVRTARQGWSGLEFASGIPGTVGGAVYMNAGANGRETCDVLVSVDYVDEAGKRCCLAREELEFAYRTSPFQKRGGAIVGAAFVLQPSEEARQKQLNLVDYRMKTQPYSEKSAGCIFRNPSSGPAGAFIEQSGLKGHAVGGAKVSELHANFIINTGEATCKDVLELVETVRMAVKSHAGIELESEVRCIPYEGDA